MLGIRFLTVLFIYYRLLLSDSNVNKRKCEKIQLITGKNVVECRLHDFFDKNKGVFLNDSMKCKIPNEPHLV